MSGIFVIGHKNPDTDSVCAAYAYAYLKNKIDKQYNYICARCGNLNKQTAFVFKHLNLTPPVLIKDIYPKVKDVMTKNVVSINENVPLFEVMDSIKNKNIRVLPVVDNENNFKGIVSVFEISNFFMNTINQKPIYTLNIENFEKVLPGYLLKEGNRKQIEAQIVVGAMPFEVFKNYVASLDFSKVVLIVGKREKILKYAIENQAHTIVITGIKDKTELNSIDFSNFGGNVYISLLDTSETLHKITLSVPVYSLVSRKAQCINSNEYIDKAKSLLLESTNRALSVVDDNKLQGIITRSDVIKKFSNKVILVDHNEQNQAIDGIETAQILEIIDHHRLSPIKTTYPIFFYAKPVGSTCTLVTELYKFYNIEISQEIAHILLSGILSDTVGAKSPTTTSLDTDAIKQLSKIANIDAVEYTKMLFAQSDDITARNPKDILESDFKPYEEFGIKFGIAQVETTNLNAVNQIKENLINEIQQQKQQKKLDWLMLLVSDIITGDSILITSDHLLEKNFSYKKLEKNIYYLHGVLSRKKQLLPEILNLLESEVK
ncbi:Manganese-dependent inorganic pyrophosphatase [Desulfurella amilsii]|uniref:inorganic diphosphatase n=1 Tax=Desulfurella amilsii TaxID=1562698 RepID=A0A1X4XV08_9BACT|nr:putative manganese-dependent inorganic diphosphatase [Desulfurella amilsii]OSS41373.1 Manganese-dependent inorganic pyrophosphatase [Desulfurella amilsii]